MSDFKNEVNIFANKILYMSILFVKLIGSIIIFILIPILTIIGIDHGASYFNLLINNNLLRYAAAFLPGVIVGLIIKTKELNESHSDDEEQNRVQTKWRDRDWKWVIGILIAVIILLLTFWLGNNQEVGGYFSFGANSVSISLGLVAIFYAFNQSEASSRQNSILENTLQDINDKVLQLSFIKEDLLKMDANITTKYDELIGITKKAETVSKINEDDEQKRDSKKEYIKELESFRKQLEKQKQKQLEDFNRNLKLDYNLLDTNSRVLKTNFRDDMLDKDMSEYDVIFEVNDNFEPIDFFENLFIKIYNYTFRLDKYDIHPGVGDGKNLLQIWLHGKGKNNIPLIKNYIYSCSKGIDKIISVKKRVNK